MTRVRIALVDDHAVVREGYRRLLELEQGFEVVAEFAEADAAYAALSRDGSDVDLAVLDLSLPGRSGLELLRRLKLRRPALRVLVFSMHEHPAMVSQCLGVGAEGFVTKSSAPAVLVDAVRRIAGGARALSPDVQGAFDQDEAAPPHMRLSPREFDVLQSLIHGASVSEISRSLRLSAKTVANYQTLVRQKLGVGNAVELLRYARAHGLG
jgi:DNA-binding NarL/FixJ family response regulator